jgi:hypothetical protein
LKNFISIPGIWGKIAVRKLVKSGYRPINKTEKIAFLIMLDWVFDHLEKIISNLRKDEYDLVYINTAEFKCRDYAIRYDSNVISIQDVIKNKLCYSLAVTTHSGFDDCDVNYNFGVELIASKIMFVASVIDFDYRGINIKPFDYIICINEYQKKQCEEVVNSDKLFVLGSPKISVNRESKENTKEMIERHTGHDINPGKKTLVWLPTHTKISSVIYFQPIIAKLQNEFNIIIKTHPLNYYEVSDFDNFMRKSIPEGIIINDVDNIKVIPIADFAVCDYGGSVFYAIHADKNVILLNTPKPELLTGTFATNTPSNIIRDRIINFYPDEEEKFFAALKDDSIWERQKEARAQIRAEFFTDNPDPARDIAELCRRIVRGEI